MVVYAWHVDPDDSADLKTIVFHFQTLLTLLTGGMQWDAITMMFLHSSSSSFNFSLVAIECLLPGWTLEYSLLVTVLLPFFIGVLALFAAGISRLYSRIRKEHAHTQKLRARMVKLFVLLEYLLYFSVALMVFQIFGCSTNMNMYYLNLYLIFFLFLL